MIETVISFQIEFAADNRFDVRVDSGFREKRRNAGKRAVVGDGEARLAELCGFFEQVGNLCDSVNGIVRVYV